MDPGNFILVSHILQGLQKYGGTPGLLYLCIKQKSTAKKMDLIA